MKGMNNGQQTEGPIELQRRKNVGNVMVSLRFENGRTLQWWVSLGIQLTKKALSILEGVYFFQASEQKTISRNRERVAATRQGDDKGRRSREVSWIEGVMVGEE